MSETIKTPAYKEKKLIIKISYQNHFAPSNLKIYPQ